MSKTNITSFVDHIGRVIIGEVVSDTKDTIKVKNPAIIHIGQNPQTGQLQVQTIPYFFREFVDPAKHKDGTVWNFGKDKIVTGDVTLDERLIEQYEKLFTGAPMQAVPQPRATGSAPNKAEVIKLFDDEDDSSSKKS
jgi:hypothetical protein